MLYREPSAPSLATTAVSDGKTFKEVADVESERATLSQQGLSAFSTINFSPEANNPLPFYVLTGLVYKGLIPARDDDQVGVSFAFGSFSEAEENRDRSLGRAPRTDEAVLEAFYRFQVSRFAYVQPDVQYIINPGGRGLTENATIIGAQFGVNF